MYQRSRWNHPGPRFRFRQLPHLYRSRALFDAWVDALGNSVSLVESDVLASLALTPVDVAPVSLVDVPSEVALTPALAVASPPVVAPPDVAEISWRRGSIV